MTRNCVCGTPTQNILTVAFLFPGQGAKSEGLLHHLPLHAEVTRMLEEASDVLGLPSGALDNAEALHSNAMGQAALLIKGTRNLDILPTLAFS